MKARVSGRPVTGYGQAIQPAEIDITDYGRHIPRAHDHRHKSRLTDETFRLRKHILHHHLPLCGGKRRKAAGKKLLSITQENKLRPVPLDHIQGRITDPPITLLIHVSGIRMPFQDALNHPDHRTFFNCLFSCPEIEQVLPFPGIDNGYTHYATSLRFQGTLRPSIRISRPHT